MEANPHYAGGSNDFKRLVFVFIDEESAYAAAQSSQLDLVRIAPSLAPTVPDTLKLWVRPSVENRGIVFPIPPAGGKDAKGYPIGNDVTSDVAVRRAINYAIDRKLAASADKGMIELTNGNWLDEIANAIENYLIQGPEWGGYLLENHFATMRSIQLLQRAGFNFCHFRQIQFAVVNIGKSLTEVPAARR